EAQGARATRLVARIAGGAAMFPGPFKGYEVGRANADVVEALLREMGIPLLSRQVGGHASRSVRLHADDGRLEVRAVDGLGLRPPRRRADDPEEAARLLLEAAAAPLSDLLHRPVVVEPSGLHDLGAAEAVAFLGPRTAMRWSRLLYAGPDGQDEVHVVIPDLHATRVDAELRARLDEPPAEGTAVDEVLNIMATHVLTALARMRRATLRPEALATRRALTPDIVDALRLGPGGSVRVAHARLHMEGAFRGVDLAVLGRALP
ncbi:MAG TPA: chemotaxis protein CheD, partial [Candidatus Thermoplasmatota archaeon]|nr:chemotaxis protein CheD [Candidatus Thermoplasmatota archaeon]